MPSHDARSRATLAAAIGAALGVVALGTIGTGGDPEVMALRLLPLLVIGVVLAVVKTWRREPAYRWGMRSAVAVTFLLIWSIGATSFMGTDDHHPADLLYVAVPAVGVLGAILARFQARGMTRAMFAMAITQMLVPLAAVLVGTVRSALAPDLRGIPEIMLLSAFFAALYLGSAWLFHRAGRDQPRAGVAFGS